MPRVVDLTLPTSAWPGPDPYYPPPLYNHHEELDEQFNRSELMGYLDLSKLTLGGPHRVAMNVTMSVDPLGTHAEVYWLDDRVLFGTLPPEKRWLIRDMTQLPVQRLVGPAAVVDVTDFGPGAEIGVAALRERARHVQEGDIVLLKTGYSDRIIKDGLKFSQANYSGSPGLSPEAGQWLADIGIKALGMDSRSPEVERKVWTDKDRAVSFPVHRMMHEKGVVLIEDLTNVTQVTRDRVWAACGIPLKSKGLSGGPARMIVLESPGGAPIDVSNPAFPHPRPAPGAGDPGRYEDAGKREQIFRRLRVQKITFSGLRYGYPGGMPDWAEYVCFNTHLGTHIVMPRPFGHTDPQGPADLSGAGLLGPATVFRLAGVGSAQAISARALKDAARAYRPGTTMILQTDYADWNYPLETYHRDTPYLDADAVAWIEQQHPPLLVCDFPAVDAADRWAEGANERTLAAAGIPIVYSCANMWLIRQESVTLACLPLAVKGLDAAPVRLIAVEGAPTA